MRLLEQFIQTVKGQKNFSNKILSTCSWRFLISNKSEQLEFKLEKNIGIYKHAEKVRKQLSWYVKAIRVIVAAIAID